ncbi:hypothetical protein PGIGA_G00187280 [Pangasianodon gigas]|uniref:Uncharacterized protein n=1 Tax=Pangasianodon gigas TaxID=30993 RepID=A0ACC5WDA4_PANGG|nr:hypothetical protein [Pangasianodon gigas]
MGSLDPGSSQVLTFVLQSQSSTRISKIKVNIHIASRWHIPVELDQGKHEEATLPAVYSHFFEESEYDH